MTMERRYEKVPKKRRKSSRYIGPGEGRPTKKATAKKTTVKHVSETQPKPKPKPRQRTSDPSVQPGLAAATRRAQRGPKKPKVTATVVTTPTARKAKVQKSGYDPLAGPRTPMAQLKKRDVDNLIEWLSGERIRMNEARLVKSRARAARIAAAAKKNT